jgi:hypothetical protein
MSEPTVKRRPMIDLEEFERRLRKPLAPDGEDNDPLAELARFVGDQEDPYRRDPYKSVFEPLSRRPASDARGGPYNPEGKEQGIQEPLIRGDFAAVEAGLLGAADDAAGRCESNVLDHSEEGGSKQWPDPDATDEAAAPFEENRSRFPLYIMAVMIAAGMAGIGLSFAFKSAGSGQNEIATIRAADGPVKVQPEAAAGTESASQDASVLGGSPQQSPVAAVNTIEQPADLSAHPEVSEGQVNPRAASAGAAAGAASVPVPPPPAQAQAQQPVEPASIAALIEAKKVKTVSVRPDGTVLPNDTPPQAAVPTPPVPAARPAPAPAAKAATPKSVARVATTPKPAISEAKSNPQPAQATVAVKAKRPDSADTRDTASAREVSPGTFAVQLAAPGTEQEARDMQVRLMNKFGADLAGFQPSIHKAAVGGKPVYRVRFGGLASREQATALCQKVQSSGGNCFVAKN